MRTVAIVQARMASTRLPGKVLLDIGGQPMLSRVVVRVQRASRLDEVIVATSDEGQDDPIADLCRQRGYACFRGSAYDLLDRYYKASRAFGAEIVVRITADCPVIDPTVVDKTVGAFLGEGSLKGDGSPEFDFAANRLPPPWGRTYPIGLDTEVTTLKNLEIAWREAIEPHQREHVMPFFYEQPERFRIMLVNHGLDYGHLRWTVDTPADLELLRQIFSRFSNQDDFSWLDILALFEREPELALINAEVRPKDYREADPGAAGSLERRPG